MHVTVNARLVISVHMSVNLRAHMISSVEWRCSAQLQEMVIAAAGQVADCKSGIAPTKEQHCSD